jgi:CRP/FNR family transcriptional regulator, cyclic AMP receptor protein
MTGRVPKHLTDGIGSLPLFSDCTKTERRRVLSLGTTLSIQARTTLTVQGDPGDEFFVAVSGSASCSRAGEVIGLLGPGDFFGEVALLDGGLRSASVIAESAMTVMVFSRREFGGLLAMPGVVRRMLPVVASRSRAVWPTKSTSMDSVVNGVATSTIRGPSALRPSELCCGPR